MDTPKPSFEPPFFEFHIFACGNRRPEGHERGCCASKGSEKIRDYMKARAKELGLSGRVRVNQAGCLDRCELGPCAVIYPQGAWYRLDSFETADAILQQHVIGGQPLSSHLLPPREND